VRDIKHLEKLLFNKSISRRDFIERMAALGAVSAIPGAMRSVEASTPKRGGVLRMGSSTASTSDSYDVNLCCTEYTGCMLHLMRNKLVGMAPGLVPVGDLAESWDVSPDASVWTFKLRSGVEYHKGGTVTPEDVIYSVNYHRGDDSQSPAAPLMAQITDIAKKGNDAVQFTLEAGNADFIALLNDPHMQIIPDGGDWLEANGTGAFKAEHFEPGVRWYGVRNDNYFREGLPYFDAVEMIAIHDPATRVSALRTDEVDVIDHPDPKVTELLKKDPNLRVEQIQGLRHMTMPMNTTMAPYDNNDLRLALKYAINREEVLAKLFRGYGTLGNDHPISPVNRYFAGDAIPQREYDPDKAAFHLKKGGGEGVEFALSASPGSGFGESVDVAILYQQHAQKAGINIKVNREPADGYWDNVWMQPDHPWVFSFWSGRPTEDWMFSQAYAADAKWNETFWSNEKFNTLLKEARTELDDDKRRDMYIEMQRLLSDEGGTVIPVFNDQIMALNKRVQYNYPLKADRMWDGYDGPTRWWFA